MDRESLASIFVRLKEKRLVLVLLVPLIAEQAQTYPQLLTIFLIICGYKKRKNDNDKY